MIPDANSIFTLRTLHSYVVFCVWSRFMIERSSNPGRHFAISVEGKVYLRSQPEVKTYHLDFAATNERTWNREARVSVGTRSLGWRKCTNRILFSGRNEDFRPGRQDCEGWRRRRYSVEWWLYGRILIHLRMYVRTYLSRTFNKLYQKRLIL